MEPAAKTLLEWARVLKRPASLAGTCDSEWRVVVTIDAKTRERLVLTDGRFIYWPGYRGAARLLYRGPLSSAAVLDALDDFSDYISQRMDRVARRLALDAMFAVESARHKRATNN